jgi:hypothetical protein
MKGVITACRIRFLLDTMKITQKTVPKLKAAVKTDGNEIRIDAFTWIGYRIRTENYAESGAKSSDEPKITRKSVPEL